MRDSVGTQRYALVTVIRSRQLSPADATRTVAAKHFPSPLVTAGRISDRRNDGPQAILDFLLHQTFVAGLDLETAFPYRL